MEDEEAGTAGPVGERRGVIGVLGAGTMGAGIAQLACRSGAHALLYDPIAEALERGIEQRAGGSSERSRTRPPERRRRRRRPPSACSRWTIWPRWRRASS